MAQIKFYNITQTGFNDLLQTDIGLTPGGIYFLRDAGHMYVAKSTTEYERYSDQIRSASKQDIDTLEPNVLYYDENGDLFVKGTDNKPISLGGQSEIKAIRDLIGKQATDELPATGLYAQIEAAKAQAINDIIPESLTAGQVVVANGEKSVKTADYTIGGGKLTDIKGQGETTPVYSETTLATEKAVAEAINAVSAAAIGVAAGDGISIVANGTTNTISTDIKIEKLTTANAGATATYQLQIKEAGEDTYKVAGVAIDIPKDMVATKGELVDRKAGETEATGTYIKMTIANGEAFYINVAELIEYNSYEDSDTIDAVEVTAGTHTYKFDVKDGSITTAKLADEAVTTAKIADANVTTDKLADEAVTTVKIADANVTTAKLADEAVTTAKIADANVTTAKLADKAVTTDKLADTINESLGKANTALQKGATADDINYEQNVTVKSALGTIFGRIGTESVKDQIEGAINALDGSATIATVQDGVVTIKAGIAEVDGKVDNNTGQDIVLAKVATTGTAVDISVADTAGVIEATNVEDALAEIANALTWVKL